MCAEVGCTRDSDHDLALDSLGQLPLLQNERTLKAGVRNPPEDNVDASLGGCGQLRRR